MTITPKAYEPRPTTIDAIEIPSPCTMADADAIEIVYRGVKRDRWDAAADSVTSFAVPMASNVPDTVERPTAFPGDLIVRTTAPLDVSYRVVAAGVEAFEFHASFQESIVFTDGPDFDPMVPPIDLLSRGETP